MSINQVPEDSVPVAGGARDQQAKQAGRQIYYSLHPGEPTTMERDRLPTSTNAMLSSSGEILTEDGKMTAVRRTFCLFTAFDLILTFILWVIYTQLIGFTGWQAFIQQVTAYDFRKSLFDTVMLSAVRMTMLLLAYALFRINHWWTVAVTTFLSCAFLIVKIFLFQFSAGINARNPLSYCLLIISFVLAWVETWFLDFKVLPLEKKMRHRLIGGIGPNERTPLLRGGGDQGSIFGDQYYSPLESPTGSDDEGEHRRSPGAAASGRSRHSAVPKEQDYPALAHHAWNKLWFLLHTPESDWTHETGKDLETGIIHSRQEEGIGKLFRLQGIIPGGAKEVWEDLVYNIEDSPSWNPTVKESKCLQVIDDNTDVSYAVAAEGAGGLVSSRDFVSVRRWGFREGWFLSSGVAAVHPDMPPQKKHVRGENGAGGWAFQPIPEDPNRCVFIWMMSTNLKGWLPQKLIDQAMSGVLMDFLKAVCAHVRNIKQQSASSVFLDPPS